MTGLYCCIQIIIFKRVNCWAHVIRKIDENLLFVLDKESQLMMGQDIDKIQLLSSQSLFDKATQLFNEKWRSTNDQSSE
jgi:hypothetical protein